jgi:hypothetical protein
LAARRIASFPRGAVGCDGNPNFSGTELDFAAGIAAHVLRRWKDSEGRAWFAAAMHEAAELLEENLETRIPLLELPRRTVLKAQAAKRLLSGIHRDLDGARARGEPTSPNVTDR